jgi:hypothetical protein
MKSAKYIVRYNRHHEHQFMQDLAPVIISVDEIKRFIKQRDTDNNLDLIYPITESMQNILLNNKIAPDFDNYLYFLETIAED